MIGYASSALDHRKGCQCSTCVGALRAPTTAEVQAARDADPVAWDTALAAGVNALLHYDIYQTLKQQHADAAQGGVVLTPDGLFYRYIPRSEEKRP
jgi:hypothetical protein